ncbi:MAG TPA: alpha/beta fold hydrolase [Candidatus Limnocylindrales bacterium]|nr:alpha/beta fold hydrolase [Candidatus Limnocylindrales bacterium]
MKRLVRPLLAGAGVTGALAATNRALGNGPLPTNALGGTRRPWTWRGAEIFATEAGQAHGPPVLLVHGIYAGASSFEYRKLFPLLARRRRVVAFDLLGCGLSDKPRIAYNTELFVEQIADALAMFGGGERVTVIASSLGAAFAIRAAAHATRKVERIAAISPAGLAGTLDKGPSGRGALMTALFRSPLFGEAAFNALASRASIRWFLEHRVYGDPARVTPEVVDHYYAVTHQPGARYVPAAFVGGALDCDVARDLPFLEIPLQILCGEKAPELAPRASAAEYVRLARDARLAVFANSGLLPHEDEPEAVDEALAAFLTPRAEAV